MIFIVTLCGLLLTAISLFRKAKQTVQSPKHVHFEKLQRDYLTVYFLAAFSDWLQGPYVYKLYSDYGYEEEEIAILYIAGFASSSIFGTVVGHVADKYGRKLLCISFGITYSLCCLTKISSAFYVLLCGRIFGGISTSILFSTFEAWYINEHINHLNLPPEWLNITLSKAGFYTGLLAILAGVISQICAETLDLGPASPFILSIPFLLLSSYLIQKNWKEHSCPQNAAHHGFFAPVYVIFVKDRILFILGLIQSLFEAVVYTFIFSWTPIISELNPPLGIVFANFMLSFMIGSKIYTLLLSDRLTPQLILVLTSALAFLSLSIVSVAINIILYTSERSSLSFGTRIVLIQICFVCFILFEMCVGVFVPTLGYLKGRVVPEENRASIANWFRVPMNLFTCVSLTLNQINKEETQTFSSSDMVFKKFHLIYLLCSIFLLITTSASIIFRRKYTRRFSKDESFSEPNDTLEDNIIKEKSVTSL